MTKLSKLKLDPEKFGHYVNNLWSAFILMDSKDDIRLLFKDMFTHTEYKMFAKRLEIARRLLQGQTYLDIKRDLKVTATTIANVNNILMERGEGYRKVHRKLANVEERHQKKKAEIQDSIEGIRRKKMSGETLVVDLITAGIGAMANKASKAIKKRSVRRQLTV